MLVAKQVADLLTITRVAIAFAYVYLGIARGASGLYWTIWLLLLSWTTDVLDGLLARRSRVQYHTWLGDHDLEVDIFISAGLLVYMLLSKYVPYTVGLTYMLLWGFVFLRIGIPRSLGMLLQAPVYGFFIYIAIRDAGGLGYVLIGYILTIVILTWPRFPQDVVPGFIEGILHLKRDNHDVKR